MAVTVEKNGHLTTIINNRPEARNAGDPQTADALTDAFLAFEADTEASVAVFWGAGGYSCAGWDLKYAASLADADKFQREIVEDLAIPQGAAPAPRGPLGPSRLELSKPVIAAVEGPAVGISPERCRRYLTENLHYNFGYAERAGLERFYELACELGLVPKGVELVDYDQSCARESR